MKTYCVKCRRDTENIDPKVFKTINDRSIMQSKCSLCKIKKSRFVKNKKQENYWVIQELKHPWVKFHCSMFCFKVYRNEQNCEQIFTGRW